MGVLYLDVFGLFKYGCLVKNLLIVRMRCRFYFNVFILGLLRFVGFYDFVLVVWSWVRRVFYVVIFFFMG